MLEIDQTSKLSKNFRSALLLSTFQKFLERTWRVLQVLSRFSGEESSPKTLHVRSSEYHIFNIFLNSLEINIFRTYLNRIFDYKYDVLVSKLVCNICNNFFLPESLLGEFLCAPWAGKFPHSRYIWRGNSGSPGKIGNFPRRALRGESGLVVCWWSFFASTTFSYIVKTSYFICTTIKPYL